MPLRIFSTTCAASLPAASRFSLAATAPRSSASQPRSRRACMCSPTGPRPSVATVLPEETVDSRRDIHLLAAGRWPTLVTAAQFRQLAGELRWPNYLSPWLRGDALEYFCNGRLDYRLHGIHVRLETRWDWQAQQGDDTHTALYRGSRSRLELRQGAAEAFRPELYVVPLDGMPPGEIGDALERRIAASQAGYPGVAAEPRGGEWRGRVPPPAPVRPPANFSPPPRPRSPSVRA